jgi:hypothetical protein
VNEAYSRERLWLHYFWIFLCMFSTITIYIVIFAILRSRVVIKDSNSSTAPLSSRGRDRKLFQRAGRYMIIVSSVHPSHVGRRSQGLVSLSDDCRHE